MRLGTQTIIYECTERSSLRYKEAHPLSALAEDDGALLVVV